MGDGISRRELLVKSAIIGAGIATVGLDTAFAAETETKKNVEEKPMTIGENVKSADFKKEKHVPVIEAPEAVKADVPFNVTVSVGKDIPHPNTTEHFIAWIALYFKPASGGAITELGKYEFSAHGESVKGANNGDAYADPSATLKVRLKASGTLIALSYCNIHGLWESSAPITVS